MNWYKITKVNSISYEIQLNDIISIETVSSEYMMQYIGKVKSNNIQNLRALCVLTGYTIIRNENNTNIIFVDFDHEHIFAKDEYYVYYINFLENYLKNKNRVDKLNELNDL